ncbi:Predicted PurR-regulated permease PerM [Agromyces sp. CF514]|uniref:AI-2E family transporter n=1 Tax=Agromyces sp. CF514 TaxID=1881031 RepID=UPI0008F3610A|nr:AI-2E family transporter [Agromyces sp. CF514]SFR66396.1 Predicted PurR-regulated permease PerM [Agromyces sp. CF514]
MADTASEHAADPVPVDRPSAGQGFTLGHRRVIALAAAVVALGGVWLARDVLGPLAVAAVVVTIAHPVRFPLERRGWPKWLATSAVVAVAWAILAALALLLIVASAQFVSMLPDYLDELEQTVAAAVSWVESTGVTTDATASLSSMLDPAQLIGFAGGLANALLGLATAFFFVLAYVIFMSADAARFARARPVFGTAAGDVIGGRYFSGVRRYYVVNATFGLVVAVIDGLILWWLGIPVPLVWAILAFVTNFIPNIGFVIGLIPPAVLALVVGGWPLALVVVLAYCVVNVTLQVLVQPKFVSDAVSLSLTLSFVSVVFWTLVIGPIGAILSIPLTLLVRALFLEPDERATTLRRLSGDSFEEPVTAGGARG